MSKATVFNYNLNQYNYIMDERYYNVGTSFQLGTQKRAFSETDFAIQDGDSNGTFLTLNTDYEFTEKDQYYTDQEGVNIWTKINILNPIYQTGDLYVSYRCYGTYFNKAGYDGLQSQITTNTNNITSIQAQLGNSKSVTSDYTITDSDGFDKFYINPTSGNITITLPTLADNADRNLRFLITDLGGKVTIDGEGGETIGGYSSIYMQSKNDNLEIIAEAGEWQIIKYSSKYDTGWQNRADWTNVHLGSSTVTYDNLSGTFTVGEIITEATSNNTGIIQSDTGSVLVLKNVTGTGIFTDGRQLTGSESGATADVNETTSNKDANSNVLHDYTLSFQNLNIIYFISSDKAEANTLRMSYNTDYPGNSQGVAYWGVDTNNVKLQTGSAGIRYIDDSGTGQTIDSEDWYYKVIIEVKM